LSRSLSLLHAPTQAAAPNNKTNELTVLFNTQTLARNARLAEPNASRKGCALGKFGVERIAQSVAMPVLRPPPSRLSLDGRYGIFFGHSVAETPSGASAFACRSDKKIQIRELEQRNAVRLACGTTKRHRCAIEPLNFAGARSRLTTRAALTRTRRYNRGAALPPTRVAHGLARRG